MSRVRASFLFSGFNVLLKSPVQTSEPDRFPFLLIPTSWHIVFHYVSCAEEGVEISESDVWSAVQDQVFTGTGGVIEAAPTTPVFLEEAFHTTARALAASAPEAQQCFKALVRATIFAGNGAWMENGTFFGDLVETKPSDRNLNAIFADTVPLLLRSGPTPDTGVKRMQKLARASLGNLYQHATDEDKGAAAAEVAELLMRRLATMVAIAKMKSGTTPVSAEDLFVFTAHKNGHEYQLGVEPSVLETATSYGALVKATGTEELEELKRAFSKSTTPLLFYVRQDLSIINLVNTRLVQTGAVFPGGFAPMLVMRFFEAQVGPVTVLEAARAEASARGGLSKKNYVPWSNWGGEKNLASDPFQFPRPTSVVAESSEFLHFIRLLVRMENAFQLKAHRKAKKADVPAIPDRVVETVVEEVEDGGESEGEVDAAIEATETGESVKRETLEVATAVTANDVVMYDNGESEDNFLREYSEDMAEGNLDCYDQLRLLPIFGGARYRWEVTSAAMDTVAKKEAANDAKEMKAMDAEERAYYNVVDSIMGGMSAPEVRNIAASQEGSKGKKGPKFEEKVKEKQAAWKITPKATKATKAQPTKATKAQATKATKAQPTKATKAQPTKATKAQPKKVTTAQSKKTTKKEGAQGAMVGVKSKSKVRKEAPSTESAPAAKKKKGKVIPQRKHTCYQPPVSESRSPPPLTVSLNLTWFLTSMTRGKSTSTNNKPKKAGNRA
jgi:hypothetical protein